MGLPLVRDVMQIGVPSCAIDELLPAVARRLVESASDALVVLNEEGEVCGWLDASHLAAVLHRDYAALTAGDVMSATVPELVADIPVLAAAQMMLDQKVRQLFVLHHLGGTKAAAVITLRDVMRAVAGMERAPGVGVGAPRPNAVDAFRHRYGLPPKD